MVSVPGRHRFGPRQAVWLFVGIAVAVLAAPIIVNSVIEWAARRQMHRFEARAESILAAELFRDSTPSYEPLLDSARLRRSELRAAPLAIFIALPEAFAEIAAGVGQHEHKPRLGAWGMRRDIALTLLTAHISEATGKASKLATHLERLGDSTRAARYFKLSYGLARMTGDLNSAGLALEWLAACYPCDTIRQDTAIAYLTRTRDLYARAQAWDALARVETAIGVRRHWSRDYVGALQWYLAALETCDAWGVDSTSVLGDIEQLRGATGEAEFERLLRATADEERVQSLLNGLDSSQSAGQNGAM